MLFVVVMTCCRSYGDMCCWGIVNIAEADVNIVLSSSDYLNTTGASQETGVRDVAVLSPYLVLSLRSPSQIAGVNLRSFTVCP